MTPDQIKELAHSIADVMPPQRELPKEGKSYPLWLLVAVKDALFCCTEDPDLEAAHKVLFAIDAALAAHPHS